MEYLRGKKILMTGSAGLVGKNMLIRLSQHLDVSVRAVYHSNHPGVETSNITYVHADITSLDACRKLVQGIDIVLMLAAKIDRRPKNFTFIIDNLNMTFCMLEAAYRAGVKKFLWLSSATGYPPADIPLKEEDMFALDPPDANFPVGWMTRYLETLCRMYALKLTPCMATIVLRPTAIYGPHGDFNLSTCHVLPALIRKVAERQSPIEIWGTGEVKRDFIFVDDVIDAACLALEQVDLHDVFNIGLNKLYSVKEIVNMIAAIDQFNDAQIMYHPDKSVKAPIIAVDCQKAKKALGFEARVSLQEGISRTLAWYKQKG
jgi:GDP-L-fucose synthase